MILNSPAPLLPDSSFLASARGTMDRVEKGHPWIYTIDPDAENSLRQELILLPTRLLEEMEIAILEDPGNTVHFTVSGPVLLYRGRNYLLPQHVEMDTEHASRPGTSQPTEPAAEPPVEASGETTPGEASVAEPANFPEDDDFEPIDQGDSISAIVAQLQEDVGPLKRGVARPEDHSDSPAGVEEGELLVSRRGRIIRDRSGAWVVVLDADTWGLMDPPMILLPSRQLVSMEAWARRGGIGRPLLISGEVFTYRGRHFLLPSAWRIPRERPNIK